MVALHRQLKTGLALGQVASAGTYSSGPFNEVTRVGEKRGIRWFNIGHMITNA